MLYQQTNCPLGTVESFGIFGQCVKGYRARHFVQFNYKHTVRPDGVRAGKIAGLLKNVAYFWLLYENALPFQRVRLWQSEIKIAWVNLFQSYRSYYGVQQKSIDSIKAN